jgi:hypothetical protein
MEPPSSPYRFHPWHAAVAACLGLALLAAGEYAAMVAAYAAAQGALVLEPATPGSSYFADDLAAVPTRSVVTMLVALPCWGLVHHYGRRGPLMALFYALVVSVVGFIATRRWAGPLDQPEQYLVYALPTVLALMLTWRLSYRRVRLPEPRPVYSGDPTPPGPWQA